VPGHGRARKIPGGSHAVRSAPGGNMMVRELPWPIGPFL
jgi:hypothetical protein